MPVKNAASVCSVPRAIVPSTSGRALDPLAKNALWRSGRYFGLIVHVLPAAGRGHEHQRRRRRRL